MTKIKLGISGLKPVDLVDKARTVIASMTANPNFPIPTPDLPALQNAADELTLAITEANSGSHVDIAVRKEKYDVLYAMLVALGGYIQSASNGDEVAIISSGFEVAKKREPVGPLPVPEGLKGSAVIGHPGSIQLDWKRVHGAGSYIVQMTTTDPNLPSTVWEEVGYPVKSRFLVNGLISGNSYWFRVMAVGAAGVGGETASINQRAL